MRIFLWIVLLVLAFEAFAQEPQVPAELLKPRRRLQGNQITFCVNQAATLYTFDRAIGEAVASTLLLKPRFVETTYTGFGLLDDGDLMTNLFVDLTNNCDAFIGFNLSAGNYPDWLSFSRSYAKVPYVLAVKNPDYKNLGDIPRGKAVGSGLGTSIDAFFGAYTRNLPDDQSWRRIPYGDFEVMMTRLNEGKIEGALLWAPTVFKLTNGNPEQAGVYIRPTDPINKVESNLGIAIRAKDVSLRTMIDGAVTSILKDGTVKKLLEGNRIMGEPAVLDSIQPTANGIKPWMWGLIGALVVLVAGLSMRLRRRVR